jgi:hypothetical protein
MPRVANRASAFQQAPGQNFSEVVDRLLAIGSDRGQLANTTVLATAAFA